MDRKNIDKAARKLLNKYLQNKCTPEEERRVIQWFYSFDPNKEEADEELQRRNIAEEINNKLHLSLSLEPEERKKLSIRTIAAIAAMLITVLTVGGLLYLTNKNEYKLADQNLRGEDIAPGSKYARIIYPDGQDKVLTDTGFEMETGNALCYSGDVRLEVPRAGEFELMLEDGTKVWLNSSTELIYPTSFDSQERRVKLIGEAYFEVAKDGERPFRIDANGTEIEVLGTAFNVNAYDKEVQTTLVEGSVKIKKEGIQKVLVPGQEGVVSAQEIIVKNTDVRSATAWQKGEFYFDGINLPEVMEQIARWYNVEYDIREIQEVEMAFKGSIARDNNLSGILEILQAATGRDFRLEGRKIIVSPINSLSYNTRKDLIKDKIKRC